jgi:hypothetical protein
VGNREASGLKEYRTIMKSVEPLLETHQDQSMVKGKTDIISEIT